MQHDAPQTGDEKLQFVSPGQYAFVQDQTTGHIKVFSGPAQCNPSTQESPVAYDHNNRAFSKTNLRNATKLNALARRGEYLVLVNPPLLLAQPDQSSNFGSLKTVLSSQPRPATENMAAAVLDIGKTVNIPGPVNFPLFPEQYAYSIEGHRLRSNEYLLVRIVDEDEAKKEWSKAVVKQATPAESDPEIESENDDSISSSPAVTAEIDDLDLSLGQLLVIKGTEVSFYIPPTGVEVTSYEDDGKTKYVRAACTLENLEYCILIDENGSKRYEEGPAVVFPEPTEQFWRDGKKNRKFRAVELNDIQGIHVKVVADYTGSDFTNPDSDEKKDYKAGDELWLTGDKTPIYLPQAEHALITYGEGTKVHFGTTVPEGEGRYVLDRNNGKINTEQGPLILLPDPRRYVMVRRTLSERQCDLWYPGNEEAKQHNRDLRAMELEVGGGERGTVTEDLYRQSRSKSRRSVASQGLMKTSGQEQMMYSASLDASAEPRAFEDVGTAVGDQGFERGVSYAQPRTLTLDTKFSGVPRICPFTGYAVQIVGAKGNREVIEGPATILLDYDHTLEVLHFSKGKQKQSEQRIPTVYLRTRNNKVSDTVDVLTSDHIPIQISVSYSVDFDQNAKERWFDVEDYVKLLTDHARSVLKGRIRKISVQEFYEQSTDIIRDICLGESVAASALAANDDEAADSSGKMSRPLMRFDENGMIVKDVDVLAVDIQDPAIRNLLESAQRQTITMHIEVQQAEEQLSATKKTESVTRETQQERHETAKVTSDLELSRVQLKLKTALVEISSQLQRATDQKTANEALEEADGIRINAKLERQKAEDMLAHEIEKLQNDLEAAMIKSRTEATTATFAAAKDGMADIALSLSNDQTLQIVAKALSLQNALGGGDIGETIQKAFKGTGLTSLMAGLTDRIRQPAVSDGELAEI